MEGTSSTSALSVTGTTPSVPSDKPSRPLRVRGKRFFLTYPRCNCTPEEALTQLQAIPLLQTMSGWIVAQEEHADGGLHLHCYLELPSALNNTVDPRTFDLTNSSEEWFHPNIQAVRSPKAVKEYVTKGSNYTTNLKLEETMRNKVAETWKRALEVASEEGVATAMTVLAEDERTARDLAINGDRIARNLGTRTTKRLKLLYSLESFGFPTTIWDPSTCATTLILTGATGIGKTQLAKALLPEALMVSHMDKLRDYKTGYHGIIFDDMSFNHLHREAQIHLVDLGEDRQIHVRYGVAEIPAGTPRIITTNLEPAQVIGWLDPAIKRRLTCIQVDKAAGLFCYKIIK